MAQPPTRQTEPATTGEGVPGVVPLGHAIPATPEPATPKRSKAHYLWAVLIARIYEVFPLLCPLCGGQMRIIAFITHSADIRHIPLRFNSLLTAVYCQSAGLYVQLIVQLKE